MAVAIERPPACKSWSTGKRTTDIDLQVARRLVAARREAKMSQEDIGAILGVTFQQIQKYERGSNRVSAGKLAGFAKAYKKPIGWFFEETMNGAKFEDVGADLVGTPHGADLARAFLKIRQPEKRIVVVRVAEALSA